MSKVIHPVDSSILRVLLDLAENRRDVKTTTHLPTLAVEVPDELYDRYMRYQNLDSSSPVEPKKKEKK